MAIQLERFSTRRNILLSNQVKKILTSKALLSLRDLDTQTLMTILLVLETAPMTTTTAALEIHEPPSQTRPSLLSTWTNSLPSNATQAMTSSAWLRKYRSKVFKTYYESLQTACDCLVEVLEEDAYSQWKNCTKADRSLEEKNSVTFKKWAKKTWNTKARRSNLYKSSLKLKMTDSGCTSRSCKNSFASLASI